MAHGDVSLVRVALAGLANPLRTVGLPYTILVWAHFRKRQICDHPFPDMWVHIRITGDCLRLCSVSLRLALRTPDDPFDWTDLAIGKPIRRQ